MTRLSVLIIDDDEAFARSQQRALGQQGYDAAVCLDPREALERVVKRPPDLVLLDVVMAPHHGREVLLTLRDAGYTGYVFMVSGDCDPELRAELLELGADDFITKPTTAKEVAVRFQLRSRAESAGVVPSVGLRIVIAERCIYVGGRREEFTETEWRLLTILRKDTPASREELRRCGHDAPSRPQLSQAALSTHLSAIRRKFRPLQSRLRRSSAGLWLRVSPYEVVTHAESDPGTGSHDHANTNSRSRNFRKS